MTPGWRWLALGFLPLWMQAASGTTVAGLEQPLTAQAGDAARGRAIVADRRVGLCLLCHSGPFPEERQQGNLASDLRGAGLRWNAAQLRLRLVDARRINPDTLMPSYFSTEGLVQVGARWRGRTLLEAQQIEDVVAFLLTLRELEKPS